MNENEVLAAWEGIAERYISVVDSAPHNALYERPAMLNMIGSAAGLDVLDLGSGSGFYLEATMASGASSATGIDATYAMVKAARERTSGRAKVVQGDLREPLPFSDRAFDLIVASLVLHYLEDWGPLLREARRVLRNNGRFVLSTGHPMADFEESPSGDYFRVEQMLEEWGSFDMFMPTFRRPLSAIAVAFDQAGFQLQALSEPKPLPEMLQVKPRSYEKLTRRPNFICMDFKTNP